MENIQDKTSQLQEFYSMEAALLKEFQEIEGAELEDQEDDPLLAADFDIVSYFNSKYTDEKSLENVV